MHDENDTYQSKDPQDDRYQQARQTELEPLSPEEAYELHISRTKEEYTDSTVRAHKHRLKHWLDWCDEEDIKNLNDLSGRDILRFRSWRKTNRHRGEGEISQRTLKTALDTLRVYLKTAARADGVHQKLPEQIDPPTLSKDENSRDEMLDAERAEPILEYLRKYEYASTMHCLFELLWHTGLRKGSIRSLDLSDYHRDEQYLQLHHRPDTDTGLKNGMDGERPVALSDDVCRVIDDYIENNRHAVIDDHGRDPLITTRYGRMHSGTYQSFAYAGTRPCYIGDECPVDKDPDECDAAQKKNQAWDCPDSVSTHPVRRGALTHWLQQDWKIEHVSGRADVSPTVLEEHYDRRTELEKMEQRRQHLDDL